MQGFLYQTEASSLYEDVVPAYHSVYDLIDGDRLDRRRRAIPYHASDAWISPRFMDSGDDAHPLDIHVSLFLLRTAGREFHPYTSYRGIVRADHALLLVKYGFIETESISYIMLISMVGFLVAVVRTPLTGIVLITEITGHLDVFYPSIIVGGLTYYFTEMLQIKPFNVVLYDEMISTPAFRTEGRSSLFVEIMTGAYFDGKEVDHLTLPQRCIIKTIHRDRKDLAPAGQTLIPGDQVEIEIDSQDIEKLYEPLISMANIY